ncbi:MULTISPECIES: hypothetical protein [unclassified Microbacterium]|uniref:hypothetical protein n=1 Tax=unclassified Microbacterium TaxID=2609290 RepID=UPI00364A4DB8
MPIETDERVTPHAARTGIIRRRTVIKGAAWSIPVIAAAVAAPARAASGQGNVVVTSSCWGLTILGIGASFPEFHIAAVGETISAGSTFILQGTGLANLVFGGTMGLFDIHLVDGNQAVVTLRRDIPAGTSLTLQVTGVAGAFIARTYSLTVGTVIGNANVIHTDDSASQRLSGVSVLGVLVGRCS